MTVHLLGRESWLKIVLGWEHSCSENSKAPIAAWKGGRLRNRCMCCSDRRVIWHSVLLAKVLHVHRVVAVGKVELTLGLI